VGIAVAPLVEKAIRGGALHRAVAEASLRPIRTDLKWPKGKGPRDMPSEVARPRKARYMASMIGRLRVDSGRRAEDNALILGPSFRDEFRRWRTL
jgi:hypothetical protein